MELETANLLRFAGTGTTVLDAGCANGYTTFEVAMHGPARIHAFDYSMEMVQAARAAAATRDPNGIIEFSHGNILEIAEPDGSFDVAYAIRVLINLPDWHHQQVAIREMHRVLKPGGVFVLTEGFAGSMRKLNALRALADLKPIAAPSFNVWLEEEALEAAVEPLFEVAEVSRFMSPYYVATRFLRELVSDDDKPCYDSELHRLAKTLPVTARSADFGGIKAYVLRKR